MISLLFLLLPIILNPTDTIAAVPDSTHSQTSPVYGQAPADLLPFLTTFYENSDDGALSMEEAYEQLLELQQNPLDINTAETEDLLQIPGLNISQISDIIEYRDRYGKIRSIYELNLIPSLGDHIIPYLSQLLTVGTPERAASTRASILLSSSLPLYRRQGDIDGTYLGDRTAHSVRANFTHSSGISFNLTGAKTGGEPFACNGNKWGYDSYAYNLTIRNRGPLKQLLLGTFRGQFGMGLTMNNGFTLGKQALLAAAGRQSTTFSPHNGSYDGKHHRGVAAVLDLSRSVQLATYFSWRYIDATLNADSTISTILTDGYHRTANEMGKKNNSSNMSAGLHLRYHNVSKAGLRYDLGASFVYAHFNRTLNPTFSKADTVPLSKAYRLYNLHGNNSWNASVDYSIRWNRFTLTGETALSDKKAVATINSLLWHASSSIDVTVVQRFYSYKYYSYYGKSFGENSSPSNESGAYVAVQWKPLRRLVIGAYTDYAHFPWYRYHQPTGTWSWDNALTAALDVRRWTLGMRLRVKRKDGTTQRLRFSAAYKDEHWQLSTMFEGCHSNDDESKNGVVISQTAKYTFSKIATLSAQAAFFSTDDYDSRVYIRTLPLLNSFSYNPFYYKGIHGALLLSVKPIRRITTVLRLSHTHYFNRSTVASAGRMISHPYKTDVDVQLKLSLW